MFDEKWKIYEVISGSKSYGTDNPDSDTDIRGIAICPHEYYLSPWKIFEQYEDPKTDRVIYELKKFIKLAADNNPNILELLFIDEKFIKFIDEKGKLLRANRDLFLSAKSRFKYASYAFAQMKRIKGHKKWIDNPPKEVTRKDFGLSESCSIFNDNNLHSLLNSFKGRIIGQLVQDLHIKVIDMEKDKLNEIISKSINNLSTGYLKEFALMYFQNQSKDIIKESIQEEIKKEIEYIARKKEYDDYRQWMRNRNPKRAEMEKKYSYDLKHATHLVRLLIQGKDILTKGTLIVNVGGVREIKDVHEGKWDLDYLIKWAENMDKEMQDIYDNKRYVVRHHVNIEDIEKLFFKILDH